ncbi:MAG: glycosyltransferase family 2 protein [Candidatus Bathyarchaeia archaeon]
MARSKIVEGKEIMLGESVGGLLVVGIPAHNEEKFIAKVVLEAKKYADRVVVCDDGSSDLTGRIAEALGAEVIRHEKNCGYGAALQSLFSRARELEADVLVTFDADGQHSPEEIPSLVKPLLRGEADLVIGSRLLRERRSERAGAWYRRAGVKLITKVSNAASQLSLKDAQSGFRAYNCHALECLCMSEEGMGASVEILLLAKKHDLRVKEVAATCNYEDVESSRNAVGHGASVLMSLLKLVVEDKPLVYLGLPGALSLILGAFFAGGMLRLYRTEHRIVTNWALASMAFVLIGFFFLSTAITLYAIQRVSKKINQDQGRR